MISSYDSLRGAWQDVNAAVTNRRLMAALSSAAGFGAAGSGFLLATWLGAPVWVSFIVLFVLGLPGSVAVELALARGKRPAWRLLTWASFGVSRLAAADADPGWVPVLDLLSQPATAATQPGARAAAIERLTSVDDRTAAGALMAVVDAHAALIAKADWRTSLDAAARRLPGPPPRQSRSTTVRRARRRRAAAILLYVLLGTFAVGLNFLATSGASSPYGHIGDEYGWAGGPLPTNIGRHLVSDPVQADPLRATLQLLQTGLTAAGLPAAPAPGATPAANDLLGQTPYFYWKPAGGWFTLQGVPTGEAIYYIEVPLGTYFSTGSTAVYVQLDSKTGRILTYNVDAATMRRIADLLYPIDNPSVFGSMSQMERGEKPGTGAAAPVTLATPA